MIFNTSSLPRRAFYFAAFLLLAASWGNKSLAEEKHFSSGTSRVSLIELYTSEGCSSCPPAEKWLAALKNNPQLWDRFVPVAFHVDYWDYIGWQDPFADSQYGQRQRQYKKLGNIRTVYTPGMLLNGREWRKWLYKDSVPASGDSAGNLTVSLNDQQLSAAFTPAGDLSADEWELNVAVLGFGLESYVRSGENAGRRLKQAFVVLGYRRELSSDGHWQFTLPPTRKEHSGHTGLAVWVNKKDQQTPIQSTGGWLQK